MYIHRIGNLSECGVLDVGLRCPHSCTFCYYSYWDKSNDQFSGLRRAPWREVGELKSTLDNFKAWGLKRFDVTGGEPTLHPHLAEVMRYATDILSLTPRVITLGQFLDKRLRGSHLPLIDVLKDSGVDEFLFSIHDIDPGVFAKITGASLDLVMKSVKLADERGISYSTNTVVHVNNIDNLPRLAEYLASTQLIVANLIIMKVEHSWSNNRDEAVIRKARYEDIYPFLREAIEILVSAGKAVNLRYGPYCAYRGLEKHLVGFKGVQLDPYEWRNGVRGGSGSGPYGKPPFLFFKTLEEYVVQNPKDVETKSGYNMTFGQKCHGCALKHICDGVDKDYIAAHGWGEFVPYDGNPVSDLLHFRRGYEQAFRLPDNKTIAQI